MTLVTPPSGPDFDVTDERALSYYRHEPGYVVHDGVSGPASNAPVVPAWAASTSYSAGQVVQHPSSPDLLLRRISAGVSRSSFDATELATWKASGAGTYVTRQAGTTTPVAPLPFVNVRDFGATADGTTDDTAAIQAAVTAMTAGGVLYFPPGKYRLTAAVTIGTPMLVLGAGAAWDGSGVGTCINPDHGVNAFTVSANRVSFRDLYFLGNTTEAQATSATTWAIKYTTGEFAAVEGCRFTFFYYGVWFATCSVWTVRGNYFWKNSGYHLYIQNTGTPDAGDQVTIGNVFSSGDAGDWPGLAQVRQESGGGNKVIANKFFKGPIGYELAIADGVSTSILPITGNSFEHQTYACIRLGTPSGAAKTGQFKRVPIIGNQFTGTEVTQGVLVIEAGLNSTTFSEVIFNNNECAGTAGTTVFVQADFVTALTVKNNGFNTGKTAVTVGGNSSNSDLGPNHITALSGGGSWYRNDSNASTTMAFPATDWHRRNTFSVTSTATYTSIATLVMNTAASCVMEVEVYGNVAGVAAISGRFTRLVTLATVGTTPVATTVGTDTTGAVPFDILFDVTVNNQCTFKLRRNAGDGGATIQGSVIVKVRGIAQQLN